MSSIHNSFPECFFHKGSFIDAFAIKLRQDLSKEILARYFTYATLTDLIEAAKRCETRSEATATTYQPENPSTTHAMQATVTNKG